MYQKVLISDDLGSIIEGVTTVLNRLSINNIDTVQYCDDAYVKLKSAYRNGTPYDLFITDLSFETDHRFQKFSSGDVLAEQLKKEHPELKIIIFSVEDRLQKVRSLMKEHHLDGYVCKGRRGLVDLKRAILKVKDDKQYVSSQVREALNKKINLEIGDFDIKLIKQLSRGLMQDEISELFTRQNITPSSLSSIEKHLNKLRIQFKAKNATHLVTIVKDLGLL